jgi:hypothetical protein
MFDEGLSALTGIGSGQVPRKIFQLMKIALPLALGSQFSCKMHFVLFHLDVPGTCYTSNFPAKNEMPTWDVFWPRLVFPLLVRVWDC